MSVVGSDRRGDGARLRMRQAPGAGLHEEGAAELYNAQKYEEAIAQYDQVIKLDAKHWEANYRRATAYLALYHPGSEHPKDKEYAEKGLAAFEQTLACTPPDAETLRRPRSSI